MGNCWIVKALRETPPQWRCTSLSEQILQLPLLFIQPAGPPRSRLHTHFYLSFFFFLFLFLLCILRHFTFSHWTIQSQRIPQVRMSHDMTHEYDVCVVRKINRASFISAIPTISAISTEAFGFYITVEWTVQWTCARPCLVFKNGCKNECFEARIPIPNNPNPLKIYIVYLLLLSSRPLQLASWIHPLRHKNLLFLHICVSHISPPCQKMKTALTLFSWNTKLHL